MGNTAWHENLCEIKFYSFTIAFRTVKLKSANAYYHVTKILSCFDNRKISTFSL